MNRTATCAPCPGPAFPSRLQSASLLSSPSSSPPCLWRLPLQLALCGPRPDGHPKGRAVYTLLTLSCFGAAPQHALRVFSEAWTTGGQFGTITEPQLVGESTANSAGEFQTAYRAVRITSDVVGITF